ncbi:MAG: hypothetical protein AAFO72_01300 [Pseudomonadota bacterium]
MTMRKILIIPLTASLLAFPAIAEETEGPSLMERGFEMFLEGLLEEMEPALDDLQGFADEMEPAFRQFSEAMGPMMRDLFDKIDDINLYELPEVLPNGDIIIRRKPDAEDDAPLDEQIEI